MSQAVLLGGLFIGVLSALPIVNVANCCCMWILGGGIITAYLAQDDSRPLSLMEGAKLGFGAGVFGAVVWLFAAAAVDILVAPLQRSAADLWMRSATDMPPDVRSLLQNLGGSASLATRLVFGFFFQLFIASPFAALGGLLGAALFGTRELPQQP